MMRVLLWLDTRVASCPFTTLQPLSWFSVMTIFMPWYGNTSGPTATEAQGTCIRSAWPDNNLFTTMLFTLCAAALETVIITVALVLLKASNSWSSSSRPEGHIQGLLKLVQFLRGLQVLQEVQKSAIIPVQHSELLIKCMFYRIFLPKSVVVQYGSPGQYPAVNGLEWLLLFFITSNDDHRTTVKSVESRCYYAE